MKINKHMTVEEIITICPDAQEVLLEYGLHCVGCGAAMWETLEEGCIGHGMGEDMINAIVEEVNELQESEVANNK